MTHSDHPGGGKNLVKTSVRKSERFKETISENFGADLFSNCGKHTLGKVGKILVKTSSIGKWREVLCTVQGKIMLNKNLAEVGERVLERFSLKKMTISFNTSKEV